jgi:5-methylcytosine-specific restriction endonuclease McrA
MEKFDAERKAKPCSALACKRPLYRRDWCAAHYKRWQAYGDPLAGGPARAIRGSVPRELQRWLKDEARRVAKAKISQVSGETAEYVAIIRKDPCSYCGAPMEHVDHIVPFAAGGPTDWTNLTPACARCNLRKNSKDLLFFLLAEGGDEGVGRASRQAA